jgi:ElaB/YqjD/DUF883 family membrane-anchored ribosome-binding protein
MGDTVEAIGYKTDVKSRARDKVSGVRDRITGAKESAPSTGDMKQGAQKAVSVAESNPLGLGIAAFAGGFLIGMLVPATNVENEKLGPAADQVKDKAKETASEAVDRGKQVAQEAASAAADTAKEQGQQHAEQMKSSVQS